MFRKSIFIILFCTGLAVVSAEDAELNPFGSWSGFSDRVFNVFSNITEDIKKNILGVFGDVGNTAGNIVNGIVTEEVKKATEVIDNVGELVELVKDGKIIKVPSKAGDIYKSIFNNINGIPADVLTIVLEENVKLAIDIAGRVQKVGTRAVIEVFSCLSEMFKMVFWNEVVSKLSPDDVQKFLKGLTGLLFKMSDASGEESVKQVERLMDEVLDEFVKDPKNRQVLKNHLQGHFSKILNEKRVLTRNGTDTHGSKETTQPPKKVNVNYKPSKKAQSLRTG